MINISCKLICGIVLTCWFADPAFSAAWDWFERGWYGGAVAGQSKALMGGMEAILADSVDTDRKNGSASYEIESTDSEWQLFGGYAFKRYWALELGYVDLGQVRTKFSSITEGSKGEFKKDKSEIFTTKALAITAMGRMPIQGGFSILAKLGLLGWSFQEVDSRTCVPTLTIVENPNTEERCGEFLSGARNNTAAGASLMFGLGVGYRLTRSLALRGEWENYLKIGNDNETAVMDYNSVSAGLEYHFFGLPKLDDSGLILANERFFYGAGLGYSRVVQGLKPVAEIEPGFTVQGFVGYSSDYRAYGFALDVEAGFMAVGDMEYRTGARGPARARGLWLTGVARRTLPGDLEMLIRLGGDFGDDPGPCGGVGLGYDTGQRIDLRLEYTRRTNIESVLFNFIYHP